MQRVAQCFNNAIDSYKGEACAQGEAFSALLHLAVRVLRKSLSILELGCGDGQNTYKLASALQPKHYDAIDCADQLIKKAQQQRFCYDAFANNVHFHCLDFDKALDSLPPKYDVIFANMSLQWSVNLRALFDSLKTRLQPNGYLCFSMPLKGTFAELEPYMRINNFYTDSELKNLLSLNGFDVIDAQQHQTTRSFSSVSRQLRHIKKTGVNCYMGEKKPSITRLRQYMHSSQSVKLSYQIGLYLCQVK